jgi:hypothetical protein
MDPTALYYALSTVAQCAAALAALLGFLGLWRLEQLREETTQARQELHLSVTPQQVEAGAARRTTLQEERQRLVDELDRFLILTLVILVVAIAGAVFADALSTRAWTWWAVKGVAVLAGLGLGVGPFRLVREVIRSARVLLVLVLLLALTTPALAGPARCLTYEEKTLNRLQTLCDDGTRAVSTYSKTLERWDTTVTPPPGQRCAGRLNPTTRVWEGRGR